MTLLSRLENDSDYRLLYARYLAWKKRRLPVRLERELSLGLKKEIMQERMRYAEKIRKRRIQRTSRKTMAT